MVRNLHHDPKYEDVEEDRHSVGISTTLSVFNLLTLFPSTNLAPLSVYIRSGATGAAVSVLNAPILYV